MTNQYLFARIAGPDPNLRAADADRERIAERLRTSHAEGRLDIAEFQQRLDRCYEAKTHDELGELVRDLPRIDEPDARRSFRWSRLGHLAPLALLVFALIAVLAATGHHHHVFWPWILLVFLFWRLSWWQRRRWSTRARRGPDGWI